MLGRNARRATINRPMTSWCYRRMRRTSNCSWNCGTGVALVLVRGSHSCVGLGFDGFTGEIRMILLFTYHLSSTEIAHDSRNNHTLPNRYSSLTCYKISRFGATRYVQRCRITNQYVLSRYNLLWVVWLQRAKTAFKRPIFRHLILNLEKGTWVFRTSKAV